MRDFLAASLTLVFLSGVATAAGAGVVYVDCNAPGPGHDGASWDTAFLTSQEGVDAATPGGEVWVADGAYVENIVMGEGVAIYGGFLGAEPGGYETERDQRDFVNNVATIDGNQSGSCVVMADGARADGFTVTNGSGTPVGSQDFLAGGGFCCEDLSEAAVIANNTIVKNSAKVYGGGICCYNSSPVIEDNIIANNSTTDGGGVCCYLYSAPTLMRNIIEYNVADFGGGVYCYNWTWDSAPTLVGNAVTGNSATEEGGGIYCYRSSPGLTNNIITENSAELGGGMYCREYSSPVVIGCSFIENSAEYGGATYCYHQSPLYVVSGTIVGNFANKGGGGLFGPSSGTIVTHSLIAGNNTTGNGGAMICGYAEITLTNDVIVGNTARFFGGAIYCDCCLLQLTNCTISDNSAQIGRALYCDSYNHWMPSDVLMANCILWDDGYEIWNMDESTITVLYSDVWGGWTGEGNIDADPMFVDPENGDFHLLPESPCIDAGCNDYVVTDEDIDGDPRIIWAMKFPVPYWPHPGYVDIGADEFVPRARSLNQEESVGPSRDADGPSYSRRIRTKGWRAKRITLIPAFSQGRRSE